MQISDSLEVGIGLSFIFFLSSLVLASIHEMIETVLKARGRYLFNGVIELFDDCAKQTGQAIPTGEAITKVIYQHPLIRGLMRGDVSQAGFKKNLPSYLPTRSFVLALIDQVTQGKLKDTTSKATVPTAATPFLQLRMMSEGIQNEQVRVAVIHALDTAGGDLDAAQANLEQWFDSAMDRVSGWYKRRSQRIIFVLGLLTALCLNVNTITIAQSLSTSTMLRQAVLDAAKASEQHCIDDKNCMASLSPSGAVAELDRTNLPVGWTDTSTAAVVAMAKSSSSLFGYLGWVEIAVGYLLTAFAVTLGAPFWFDVLNRLMVIRATVKPTEKSPDEASQDPQPSSGGGPVINNIMSAPPPADAGTTPPAPPPIDTGIYLTEPGPSNRLFEDDDGKPVNGMVLQEDAP